MKQTHDAQQTADTTSARTSAQPARPTHARPAAPPRIAVRLTPTTDGRVYFETYTLTATGKVATGRAAHHQCWGKFTWADLLTAWAITDQTRVHVTLDQVQD